MRYFTLFFTLILLLVGCSLVGCGRGNTSAGQASNAKANIRTITISREALSQGLSDTLQLGRMHQGEVIATDIRLVNGDSLPMVILREATSCGCTKATYSRKPIATGTSCDIVVEFDSRSQMGWQMKLMEFYFAHSDSPLKIYIDAEVE